VQLLASNDQLNKLQMEKEVMSDTLQQNAHDLVKLDENCQHLELELAVSQEKHRTCQAVVSGSDWQNYVTW
jgi:predicted  nucleic acid-binding Zn-ribbon protein